MIMNRQERHYISDQEEAIKKTRNGGLTALLTGVLRKIKNFIITY